MSAARRWLRPETVVPMLAFGVVLVAYLLTPAYSGHELSDFDAYNTLQGFASLGSQTTISELGSCTGSLNWT